ncbi:ATP-binding protein [Nocardioides astragali]|uniref:ATP-binding protein n=1 Tax=Nocardioides astragali TaxID=1776736 RepID=A0ABW2N043_9ACTN|nr:AAA family ATPase [Nocardioides astragali]
MSALPRADLPPGPHRDLVAALHDLHHRAGWPSLRTLARDTGVSHTTVSKVFSAPALPTWGTLELLVEAMGGDPAAFHHLWLSASGPADGSPAPTPPIAGRTAELAAVRRHLESGTGLLLVTGEAGIGKTTLVGAAAASVDTVVAVGHCLQLSSEVPLLPVVDVLRGLYLIDDAQWMKEGLADCPPYVRASVSRLLPELQDDAPAPQQDDPWGLERLFSSIGALLGAMSATRSLALHVEDCHWADRSTLDLLTHLVNRPSDVPLVVTWRSDDPDVSAGHSEWLSRARWTPGVASVDLGPMSPGETAQQLRLLMGSELDGDAVELIHVRSQGLPLYTAQLATMAPDAGLPRQLAELLDRRIGDLDGASWRVARVLGVAQRRLGPATLLSASGLEADQADGALRTLERRGLLRIHAGNDAGLAHPLFTEAIERRLLPGEAARVHARLAEALATEPDIEPGEIAGHWQAAGRPDLEATYRVAAARRAGDRFAYRDELDAWLRVLELWDRGSVPADMELWDVLVPALDTAFEIGETEVSGALARRAEALDLPDRQRAAMLHRVGRVLCEQGSTEHGLVLLDEALTLHDALPPSAELMALLANRGTAFVLTGRYAEAQTNLHRVLDALEEFDDPRWRRRILGGEAWLTMHTGDFEAALTLARRALTTELPEPDPLGDLALAATTTDILLHAAAPGADVEETARDALRQGEARNLVHTEVGMVLRINVCEAHLRSGDVGAAHEVLRPVTRSGPTVDTAIGHLMLGAVELRQGHVRAALERSRAADALVRNHNQNWAEGIPWHADVELWAGKVDAALALLQEALDVTLSTQAARMAAPLVCVHARAHADRLEIANATATATATERHRVTDQLRDMAAGALVDPFGEEAFDVAVPAWSRSWRAELSRIRGDGTVEAWVSAASEWDRLTRPHDAAYCRWRGAQVALREGRGTVAGRLLGRAATDAREHVPLSEAIVRTRGKT